MRKTRYFVLAVTGGSTTAWRVGPALGTPGTGPPRPSTWLQTFPRTHQVSYMWGLKLSFCWERIKKKAKKKQEFQQEYFIVEQYIWTNRKGETKLYLLPIGRNTIVHQENKNILDEICVSLFLIRSQYSLFSSSITSCSHVVQRIFFIFTFLLSYFILLDNAKKQ